MGFEALSRGARSCIFVEKNRLTCEALKKNKDDLNLEYAEIVHSDADVFLKNNSKFFDIIFFDPPFADSINLSLLIKLREFLNKNGFIYLESNDKFSNSDYKILKEGHAGQVYFYLLQNF